MVARMKRNLIFGISCFVVFQLCWVFFSQNDLSNNYSGSTQRDLRLAELKERLAYAENLDRERKSELQTLHQRFGILIHALQVLQTRQSSDNDANVTGAGNLTSSLSRLLRLSEQDAVIRARSGTLAGDSANRKQNFINFAPELKLFLQNITHNTELQLPSVYYHMPHLSGKTQSLVPAFKSSKGKSGVTVVLGVPTIKRPVQSYLTETIRSLIDGLSEEERPDVLIIVMVAEPSDSEFVRKVDADLRRLFLDEFNSGLLEVIGPDPAFYPNLDNIKETLGDSKLRVKWRTKQNLDFSYLMMYAQSRGRYYCQMEDDVIAKPGYLSAMKTFALKQTSDEWILLEFSHLGFIGKLFKTADIPAIVEFVVMFYKDKPVDLLLDHYVYVKVCSMEKDWKHCQRQTESVRIRLKPSLFQHIGEHSSLKGKVQKLKDKDFDENQLHRPHLDNAPAEVSTSLEIYQKYHLDRAYKGDTFFWGLTPKQNDFVQFKFTPPIRLKSFFFKSGNVEHPGDKFFNTTVEALPLAHQGKEGTVLDNLPNHEPGGFARTDTGHLVLTRFSESTGVAALSLNTSSLTAIGPIAHLRLRCLTNSNNWVILNEISIKAFVNGTEKRKAG